MFPEISCVIPGASKSEHVQTNLKASELPDISESKMKELETIYNEMIKDYVHNRW